MAFTLYTTSLARPAARDYADWTCGIWTKVGTWTCRAHVDVARDVMGYAIDQPGHWTIVEIDTMIRVTDIRRGDYRS